MFKNYLKTGFRSLWRKKFYTIINILGLSLAIACAIVAYLNYTTQTGFDSFHKNSGEIYRILCIRTINNNSQRYGSIPIPLREYLKQDVRSIEKAANVEWSGVVIRLNNNTFNENILYTNDDFFDMFTFPMKYGTNDLKNKTSIVISEEYSIKYFGDKIPIGESLVVTYPNGIVQELKITGVVKKYPLTSSIKFDIAASNELLYDAKINKYGDWSNWGNALFVQVKDKKMISTLNEQLKKYVSLQAAANYKIPVSDFVTEPLEIMANKSREIRSYSFFRPYPASQIYGTIVIAVFILLMACFNFINTSLALASRRLKEICVRKVLGSQKKQLIFQFLSENIILCTISLLLSFVLANIFIPAFNRFFPEMILSFNLFENYNLILFLIAVVLLIGIGAGLYPTYIISSYNPINIIRDKAKSGNISIFMRVLLTAQFIFTIISIISSVVFTQNAEYNKEFDLGYEKHQIVQVPVLNESNYTIYKNEILTHPNISSISGSQNQVYYGGSRRVAKYASIEREALLYGVGYNYIETMKLHLTSGRKFDENILTDNENSILVNECFVKEMGLQEPIGKTITLEEKKYSIIGVIKDFYHDGVWSPILPSVLRLVKPEKYFSMQIQTKPERLTQTFEYLKTTWTKLFPYTPFMGMYSNQNLAESIRVTESIADMFNSVSIMNISIAVMGLFALVSLFISRRIKEIGIRKALGASVLDILSLVNRQFYILFFIAMIVASIGGYYLLMFLMDKIYTYHINVSAFSIIISNILIFITAILTILSRTWKTAKTNPVESLRYE
jgi:putative ABC transport system permease protein